MRIAALAASVSILLAACGGSDSSESREVPFMRVDGEWVFVGMNQTFVIRDHAEWVSLWSTYAWKSESGKPFKPLPSVDFSRHMVVGLTHGVTSKCYRLYIRSVFEHEHELEVEYLESTPDPNATCPQGMVDLTSFVAVVRSDKPVTFRRVNL